MILNAREEREALMPISPEQKRSKGHPTLTILTVNCSNLSPFLTLILLFLGCQSHCVLPNTLILPLSSCVDQVQHCVRPLRETAGVVSFRWDTAVTFHQSSPSCVNQLAWQLCCPLAMQDALQSPSHVLECSSPDDSVGCHLVYSSLLISFLHQLTALTATGKATNHAHTFIPLCRLRHGICHCLTY